LYDPERAVQLLASIGMSRDADGVMRDVQGREVEFDLTIPADNAITNDLASIIVDECARVGIRVQIRATDFQKVVEQLTGTYDWQSVIIGLGANYWPTQGSNVWPSTGNLHLWYPLQESPATDWEARVDHLYNEGRYTLDRERAEKIWNEYQTIFLEQCPVIYLVRPRAFTALRNRWDFSNVYYDNIGGLQMDYAWLRPEESR
jgi:peptide/nickel transport system substrate-binding protein